MSQLAYEEAADCWARALRVVETMAAADESVPCDLLLRLGDARWRAGETKRARETFLAAADVARKLDRPLEFARAALGYGAGFGYFGYAVTANETLVALLEEALTRIGAGDGVVRVRLLARLAVEHYYTGEAARREALSREAVQMAERIGDPSARFFALYSLRWA
ncbi:MAG: hypothetical protein ACREQ9_26500, partial [Candidatus Binatia bacterium]